MRHDDWVGAAYSPDGRAHPVVALKTRRLQALGRGDRGGDRRASCGHDGPVYGAVYSPDGKRILSWSEDKTLRFWDAATEAAIGAPMRHEDLVRGAVYSPDGKRILSWSSDKTLRFWDASWLGDDLFEIACNYTPMMSSKEEMERLSKHYGVKIEEPICQPGVKIPDRTGAHGARACGIKGRPEPSRPAAPSPAKPIASIAEVEGSGTAALVTFGARRHGLVGQNGEDKVDRCHRPRPPARPHLAVGLVAHQPHW